MRWRPETAFLAGACLILACVAIVVCVQRSVQSLGRARSSSRGELPAIQRPPHRLPPASTNKSPRKASTNVDGIQPERSKTPAAAASEDLAVDNGIAPSAGAAANRGRDARPSSTEETAMAALGGGTGRGIITGRVLLLGTPPAETVIDMSPDAKCKSLHETSATTRHFVVNDDGTLQNVFVYVKSGPGVDGNTFEPPKTKVTLDQKGCLYFPYVFGVMVNQQLEILNSDDTLHNVHALPTKNEEFNKGQPMRDMKFTHKFTKPEMPPIKFKCDVHPWMFAYCAVLPHPFFDVTREGGTFKISGLPPGKYVLEAWHHKAGILDQKVTLTENETEKIVFEFSLLPASP